MPIILALCTKAHVELLCGILSGEGQDGKLTPRVFAQETGHIQHLSIHLSFWTFPAWISSILRSRQDCEIENLRIKLKKQSKLGCAWQRKGEGFMIMLDHVDLAHV